MDWSKGDDALKIVEKAGVKLFRRVSETFVRMAFIQYLARIQIEFGARALISAELTRLGVLRPLVISDSGLVDADALDVALSSVVSAKQPRFIEVASNPTEAAKEARDVFLGLAHAGVVAAGTSFNQTAARIGSADDYACIARAAFK